MSQENPDTTNDEEIARTLQRTYISTGHGATRQKTIVVYGTPLDGSPLDGSQGADLFIGVPEHKLLDTYSLSRAIRILAILDGCILLFLGCFGNIIWFLFIWGPGCGYLGAIKFDVRYIYVYIFYYVLRTAVDLAFVIMWRYLWLIFAAITDLILLYFVSLFASKLNSLSYSDISQLQHPYIVWDQARPYFYFF
jgi:hypothetical protein